MTKDEVYAIVGIGLGAGAFIAPLLCCGFTVYLVADALVRIFAQ